MVKVSIIVAVDNNNNIAIDDKIYWNCPEDMREFKKDTLNTVLIVGHKTFCTFKKPLKDRVHIVVTRSKKTDKDNVYFSDLKGALKMAKQFKKDISVIGGLEIYNQFLELNKIDRIVLSCIPTVPTNELNAKKFYIPPNFRLIKTLKFETFVKRIYEPYN